MNRSQNSKQLVYLLGLSGALGTSGSAIEATLPIENYIASGLTLPLAAVQTLEAERDRDDCFGRMETAKFLISIVGGVVTETRSSTYLASGGTASSQASLEDAVASILVYLNGGTLIDSTHGMQGTIERVSTQRQVVVGDSVYAVADLEVTVTNPTSAAFYHAVPGFAAAAGASHSVSLAWRNPPTRFDQYENSLWRGTNPGDAAPTAPGAAGSTQISITGGALGTTASDTGHGIGQAFNYSIFRTYTKTTSGDKVSIRATATATTT